MYYLFFPHLKMRFIIIIPARYSSTRLPGKPLLRGTGKYLIQHTFEAAKKSRKASGVIAATDDERIADAVRGFGGEVVMTSPGHASGTDRVAEAAADIEAAVVVNLQGDEPEMPPSHIDALIGLFEADPELKMATLAVRKSDNTWLDDPNNVKVTVGPDGYAREFSRSIRPGEPKREYLKHLGIYGYRKDFLLEFVTWPPSEREKSEHLEQLRAVDRGTRIKVAIVNRDCISIDTREDYEQFKDRQAKGTAPSTGGPGGNDK